MTQRRKAFSIPPTNRCSLLLGLSLIGGIGVFGGGVALAQMPASDAGASTNAEGLAVPSTPVESVRPIAPAPQVTSPRRSQAASNPLPRVERVAPSADLPTLSVEPERFPPEMSTRSTSSAAEQPSTSRSPNIEAGSVPSPTVTLPQSTTGTATSPRPNYNDLYIDPTNYQLGATRQPGVVLSERSTGCEVVLQPGQNLPNSVCVGSDGQLDSNGAVAAGVGSQVNGINIGPIRLSSRGVSITPQSVQDFYNRTLRPMAMRGNGNASLMFPLTIPASITSAFGWRIHPISGTGRFHAGTDLGAPTGTPVVAAYSGRVDTARFMGGYGLAVVLAHGSTEESLYAHLSEIFVQPGQQVQQGEVIGRVGSTGNSTGPHLHFEFRELTSQGWVALNPGLVLENALARFTSPFQVAQVTPTSDSELPTIAVKGLEDFGKLASDAKPSATLSSMATSETAGK